MASQEGHTDVVDVLLKNGADSNLATKVWNCHACCIPIGYIVLPLNLVENAVYSMITHRVYHPIQSIQSVPLGIASQEGHTGTVERLLDGKANVNYKDKVRSA